MNIFIEKFHFKWRDQPFSFFRFWWEAEGIFTQHQKAELSKGSLSRIICDNTDIREVPYDPFRFGKYPSDYVSCNHIPSMNLEAWREERSGGGLEKLLGFFLALLFKKSYTFLRILSFHCTLT